MKEQKTFESQIKDSLQLQAARTLVNSDKWSKKLDSLLDRYVHFTQWSPSRWRPSINNQFYEKWPSVQSRAIPEIEHEIRWLFGRTLSESELEIIMTALQERYKVLYDINKIQEAFGVPEMYKIKTLIYSNSQIDLIKTLEPIKHYFKPDLTKLENFKIVLRLKQFDIAKRWIHTALNKKGLDSQYFIENIREIFVDALLTDVSFIESIVLPDRVLVDYSYNQLYSFLFKELIDKKVDLNTVKKVWSNVDDNSKLQVLMETINTLPTLNVIPDFLADILPENWQNDDSYRNIFLAACRKACQENELDIELLRSLINIKGVDSGILNQMLTENLEQASDLNLLSIFRVFIDKFDRKDMPMAFFEYKFTLIGAAIENNEAETLDKIWDYFYLYERENSMTIWLNENIHKIGKSNIDEPVASFILQKLNQENKQRFIVNCVKKNLKNSELIRYLAPMIDKDTKDAILSHLEKIRGKIANPDLYNDSWHDYVNDIGFEKLNKYKMSLAHLFGSEYANSYFEPAFTCASLLRNKVDVILEEWNRLSPDMQLKLCGPIFVFLFKYNILKRDYSVEEGVRSVLNGLFKSLSEDQALQVQLELSKQDHKISSGYGFLYWIERYASKEFILKLGDRKIHDLIVTSFNSDQYLAILKILDTLDNANLLKHLRNIKNIRGVSYIAPFTIRASIVDSNFKEVVNSSMKEYFQTTFRGDNKYSNISREFIKWIGELISDPSKESKEKLEKISATIIKYEKTISNRTAIICHIMTELISDRGDNPLLNGSQAESKRSFSELINPIDGQKCRSKGEQILIKFYSLLSAEYNTEYHRKYSTYFPKEKRSRESQLPRYAESAIEPAQTAAGKEKKKEESASPKIDK